MAVTNAHTLYGALIDSTLIGGVTQQNIKTETEIRGEASSGEPYARYQSMVAQKPGASFTTMAIKALLDKITTLGTVVNVGAMAAGVSFYAHKFAEGASRETGASHDKYNFTEGIIVPRRLSCDHQGDARLTCDMVATYDGSNDPFTKTEDVSLPAGLTDAERFTIGKVVIEGTTYDHIQSFELDFGIEVVTEGADSEIWDRYCCRRTISPELRLTGVDVEWLKAANIPLAGLAVTQASSRFFLRKRDEGAKFVADNVAEHIKFNLAGMAYIETPFDADSNEKGQVTLVIPVKHDGSNDPIVVNTAIAIT